MDFQFTEHGTVWTIEAVSDAAITLANENFGIESWQGTPVRFTTDHRPAIALADKLISEGWSVGVSCTFH